MLHIVHIKRFIVRNWLIGVWRPRRPTTCSQQYGDPGEPMVWSQSEPKSLRAGRWCNFQSKSSLSQDLTESSPQSKV